MVSHLVGLQAQENLPPYLSLAARLTDLDPEDVSRALEDRSLVRLLTMRGTIHLLTADDALTLRQWTQPCQDRERRSSQNTRPALHLDTETFNEAVRSGPGRRAAPDEGAGRGPRRHLPRRPRQRARPPGPGQPAARPAAAARGLEAVGRRRLPVRRPLGRPSARRAGPARDRPPLPARLRAGLRGRRHGVVGRDRDGRPAEGDGRPGGPRGPGRPPALRRGRRHPGRRGGAGTRAAARHLRQRLALPRRLATG